MKWYPCVSLASVVILAAALGTSACGEGVRGSAGSDRSGVFYDDVQAVFDARCIGCHPPGGGLSLRSYDELLDGGASGLSVEPGDPQSSVLMWRIEGDPPPRMPLGSGALSEEEVMLISDWIEEGAQY